MAQKMVQQKVQKLVKKLSKYGKSGYVEETFMYKFSPYSKFYFSCYSVFIFVRSAFLSYLVIGS